MQASLLFDGIADWLIGCALRDAELETTVRELGRRLIDGGMPVCRINVGSILLHPVLGALDLTWDAASDSCRSRTVARAMVRSDEFRNAPFFQLVSSGISFVRHRLDEAAERARFPLFEDLARMGVTDYVALFETYGRNTPCGWADLPSGAEGALFSFATRRIDGFLDREIEGLRHIGPAFALAVKTTTEHMLAAALLETYLGRISGSNVLAGLVERGDGRLIECVLWLSDLRGSTAMATALDLHEYFSVINEYFDCTAGSVLDHGGEVLKFIGDSVMAIFPIEEGTRPASDMANAAIATAREAMSRGALVNHRRAENGLPPISFGIGLHAGSVIYGNVGTARRLDLTVTGPAANEVQRLESVCKSRSLPLVISGQFRALYRGDLVPLGSEPAVGIDGELEIFTLPGITELPPPSAASGHG